MCLAIPLKITEIIGKEAIAELEGVKQKIRVDFIKNLKVGDYVIVHAGFALERLDEEQAKANIELIKEVTDAALGTI
jgi:hydrogenase expression/formation protein HypC